MAQVKKTAKYYRDIFNGNDVRLSLSLIPEVIKKFGFADKYRSEINLPRDVVHDNFNWNHSIEGFDLAKNGVLYAKVYWQGDSTDGTAYVPANYLIGGYTVKAEWDNVGGDWGMVCRHSPLNIDADEIKKAIKAIVPLLSADLIKARRKYVENEPFVMPMYGRINRWLEVAHPYNRWGSDAYQEKWHNAEKAIRELAIPDAKKFMQMPVADCNDILDSVFDNNFKLDTEFTKNEKGEKIFNLTY